MDEVNAMGETAFVRELERLAEQGLNWMAYVPACHGPPTPQLRPTQGLLLLIALGPRFGSRTRYREAEAADAFDTRARGLASELVERHLRLQDPETQILYPGAANGLDLRAWLRAAKVQYPSRLGIGIRPDVGTWFAVRAAVATTLLDAQRTSIGRMYPELPEGPSPCDVCTEAPCVQACPASAIDAADPLIRCVNHRVDEARNTEGDSSSCASRCHSRSSCPVGLQHRYPDALMRYHYQASLVMLRRWKAKA